LIKVDNIFNPKPKEAKFLYSKSKLELNSKKFKLK